MIESKIIQRIAGVFLLLLGGWFTMDSWRTFLNEGYYYRKAVALFPVFAVCGLGLILFPLDFERLRAEHGVDKPTKFAHYPPAWKVLFFVMLLAGFGNWFAIAHW